MKKIFSITTILYLSLTTLTATETSEGKELYMEADCQKCHNIDKNFDAKEKKTKNLSELKGWVTSCANYFDVEWFPEEEEKVIKYIDNIYYKFPSK